MKAQPLAAVGVTCALAGLLMVGAAYAPHTAHTNLPDLGETATPSVTTVFSGKSEAISDSVGFALEEQGAQAGSEIKSAQNEAIAKAAEAEIQAQERASTATSSAKNTNPITKQASSCSPSSANSTRTITINGVTMSYSDSYGAGSAPSSGAGIWKGSDSTTDGSYSYYIGHNPGPFSAAATAGNGSQITVNDSNGNSRTYTVVDTFVVSRDSTWSDVSDRVTSHGESVALQTCVDGGYKVIIAE